MSALVDELALELLGERDEVFVSGGEMSPKDVEGVMTLNVEERKESVGSDAGPHEDEDDTDGEGTPVVGVTSTAKKQSGKKKKKAAKAKAKAGKKEEEGPRALPQRTSSQLQVTRPKMAQGGRRKRGLVMIFPKWSWSSSLAC